MGGRGSNFFRGVGGSYCLFPIELTRGGPNPLPPPPSGSALGTVHGTIHSCRECIKSDWYVLRYVSGRTFGQTDRQKGAQTADGKTISLRLHRGETSTEHRIFSVMFKNTTQCFRWGSIPQPIDIGPVTLPRLRSSDREHIV